MCGTLILRYLLQKFFHRFLAKKTSTNLFEKEKKLTKQIIFLSGIRVEDRLNFSEPLMKKNFWDTFLNIFSLSLKTHILKNIKWKSKKESSKLQKFLIRASGKLQNSKPCSGTSEFLIKKNKTWIYQAEILIWFLKSRRHKLSTWTRIAFHIQSKKISLFTGGLWEPTTNPLPKAGYPKFLSEKLPPIWWI